MTTDQNSSWFPLFEFQDWIYDSFLVLPTSQENSAIPGSVITARKWAKGTFECGQAFNGPEGYTLGGVLIFDSPPAPHGTKLQIAVKGAFGAEGTPATFKATATGAEGITKGTIYELTGWVFPEDPVLQSAGRVLSVRGSVQFAGPTQDPKLNLAECPLEQWDPLSLREQARDQRRVPTTGSIGIKCMTRLASSSASLLNRGWAEDFTRGRASQFRKRNGPFPLER